jgi:hypothetical protein
MDPSTHLLSSGTVHPIFKQLKLCSFSLEDLVYGIIQLKYLLLYVWYSVLQTVEPTAREKAMVFRLSNLLVFLELWLTAR